MESLPSRNRAGGSRSERSLSANQVDARNVIFGLVADNVSDACSEEEEDEEDYDSYDRVGVSVDMNSEDEEEFGVDSDKEEGELNDGEIEESGEFIPDNTESMKDSEILFNTKGKGEKDLDMNAIKALNPTAFESYIKKVVAKEMESERKRKSTGSGHSSPAKKQQKQGNTFAQTNPERVLKSPSDTTIYAPALSKLANDRDKTRQIVRRIIDDEHSRASTEISSQPEQAGLNANIADQITHFIEGVRLQNTTGDKRTVKSSQPQPGSSAGGDSKVVDKEVNVEIAKQRANQMVLDAERFKASVNVPPGTYVNNAETDINNIGITDKI